MEFNAYENIYLTLLLNGFNSSYAKEKAIDLLKIVNLENRALHKPSALSGGEQQRVAIVRAISNSPEIIIADGSNYPSFVARWKATCEAKNTAFHSTSTDGSYPLN